MAEDYFESPTLKFAQILREKGYELANSIGRKVTEADKISVGILRPQEVSRKRLFGLFESKETDYLFIGSLFVGSSGRPSIDRAKKLEHDLRQSELEEICSKQGVEFVKEEYRPIWFLSIYGREYVDELTELVVDLSKQYNARLSITLETETPRKALYSPFLRK